ncbi:hypothetical protein NW752_003321 [Fusarium irregulare]|uniref:Uncharacterized protein n=1 Tax=Fusarium irregulare TaxID=2494466 RepID=A0A9W8PTC7_9HYPO|nr:hypothetical protein NW766_004388 [Fusarium irregulare]KAJ4022866.1 hypothetical protein NW752_003321 [Fusarium irregulare]
MENEFMLREKSRRCKQLFQRCLQNLTLNDDDWVEQKSAEFNWWKAGLNADKSGPGSLDSQLGLRPDVKEAIAEVLDNLATALLRFMEIEPSDSQPSNNPQETAAVLYHDATVGESGRSPSPWSDMTDGTGHQSELSTESSNVVFEDYLRKEQRSHVDINIEILLRIHAVIKKSGLKFRNKRADDQLKKDEDEFRREKERIGSFEALSATNASIGDHERFRGFLTRLVLHNGYTEGLIRYMESRVYAIKQEIDSLCAAHDCRSQHERSSSFYQTLLVIFRAYFCDPARLTPIQRRLVNANVVRRNRLVYAGGVSKLQSSGQQTVPQILKEIRSQEASLHTQNPKDYVEIIPAAPISQAPSVAIPESRTSFYYCRNITVYWAGFSCYGNLGQAGRS